VQTLLDIEIATKLMETDGDDMEEDPLDVHYKKLKTSMTPLEEDSSEFKMIDKYIKNTHAATHSQYKLKIRTIFKISREGEDSRFETYKK